MQPEERSYLECGINRKPYGNKAEMDKFYSSLHKLSFQNYLRHMSEYSVKKHIQGK